MFDSNFTDWTTTNILIRMLVAMFLGSIIGINRGVRRKGAGMKTHTILCLGSALVSLTAQFMSVEFPGEADMSRMGAQVVSGVGFLGVGTILVSHDHQIRGLTTAASLWTCACIGLAVGCGFVEGGILASILVLFALQGLPMIDNFLTHHSKFFAFCLEIDGPNAITQFLDKMQEENILIDTFEVIKPQIKKQNMSIIATVKINNKYTRLHYKEMLTSIDGVLSIKEI